MGDPRQRARAVLGRRQNASRPDSTGWEMLEHQNLTIARRLWDSIAQADDLDLRALLSEKSVWRMPGESPLAGSYVGPDEILGFMARVGEQTTDLQSQLLDVYVSERGAVLRYGIRAVRGIDRLETEHLFMIQIEDGQIVQATFAPVDPAMYDRFFTPQ